MSPLAQHIEALVFCAQKPLKIEDIQNSLHTIFESDISLSEIEKEIHILATQIKSEKHSFELVKTGGGYQFLTQPAFQPSIEILLKHQSKKRLSSSALETLTLVAYKQPVTKTTIENIRGVGCDYALQRLLEKELIEIVGKSDALGRPILYGTTQKFMDYFGINDLKELPTPKDFKKEENTIGAVTD